MVKTQVDVVVVGGGPAGIAASITMRRQGLKVTIVSVESKRVAESDHPLESVEPVVELVLEDLGVPGVVAKSSISIYDTIQSPGHSYRVPLSPQGISYGSHISRHLFDENLLQAAAAIGVKIIGAKVIHVDRSSSGVKLYLSNNQKITSKYVIDASGRAQILGRRLQFHKKYYSPPLTCWSGVARNIDKTVWDSLTTSFIPHTGGWTWFAPHGVNKCTWTKLSVTGAEPLIPPWQFTTFDNGPHIRSSNVGWRLFQPVASKNVILVGDAASVIDPAAGQGILNALWSGKMAGQTVLKLFNDTANEDLTLSLYDRWYKHRFESLADELRCRYENLGIML